MDRRKEHAKMAKRFSKILKGLEQGYTTLEVNQDDRNIMLYNERHNLRKPRIEK